MKYGIWNVNEPDPRAVNSLVTGGYETDTSMLDEEFGINLMNAALAAARSLR